MGFLKIRKVNVPPDSIQVIPLANPTLVETAFDSKAKVVMGGYPDGESGEQTFQLKVGRILPREDPIYTPFEYRRLNFPLLSRGPDEPWPWIRVPEEYVGVHKDDLQEAGGMSGGAVLYRGRIIGVIGFGPPDDRRKVLAISATTVRVVLQALVDSRMPNERFEDATDADAKAAFAEALRQTAAAGLEGVLAPVKPAKTGTQTFVVNLLKVFYRTDRSGALVLNLVQGTLRDPERLPGSQAEDIAVLKLEDVQEPAPGTIVVRTAEEYLPQEETWKQRGVAVVTITPQMTLGQLIQEALAQWTGKPVGDILQIEHENGQLRIYT